MMEIQEQLKKKQEINRPLMIRKAETDDYETVRILEELNFSMHRQARPDYFKDQKEGYDQKEFEDLLSLPCPISWLAVQDGHIVGLCFGKIEMTPGSQVCKARRVAYIEDLVTLPECRGRGVATALMAQARKQAVSEGVESLELCVWNFNENALRLYKRLGMQIQYYRMEEKLDSGCE